MVYEVACVTRGQSSGGFSNLGVTIATRRLPYSSEGLGVFRTIWGQGYLRQFSPTETGRPTGWGVGEAGHDPVYSFPTLFAPLHCSFPLATLQRIHGRRSAHRVTREPC